MNQLKHFDFKGIDVRMAMKDGKPWWSAFDVCMALELSNPTVATQRLDEDEVTKFNLGGLSGETNFVNEAGLYALILGSRKPQAKEFKRWVTHEVLPSIRQTGSYGVHRLPQNYIEALEALVEQTKNVQALQEEATANAPKVALYDTAMSAGNNQTMGSVAKELGIGRNKLFALLREKKILMRNNLPYQEFIDRGYFDVRMYTITHFTSGLENKNQTLVTAKGVAWIHRILQEQTA